MSTPTTVRVHILDNEYQIACTPEEKDALLAAARYLDDKMRVIKSSGNVIGVDRVAVMAGLNIAHELLNKSSLSQNEDDTVQRLSDKIARALGSQSQLEL
jgi:cell division protein ZapA